MFIWNLIKDLFDPIVKYNLTEIVKMSFVVLKAIKCIVFCMAIALLTGS